MNEIAWHDLFNQAVTLFASESQMFQGAVGLGGLVLLALVLEGLSSLLFRRHRFEPEAPIQHEPAVVPVKSMPVPGNVWKKPGKPAPNRKRFLRVVKRVDAMRPKISHSAVAAPGPALAKPPGSPVAMSDFSQPMRRAK